MSGLASVNPVHINAQPPATSTIATDWMYASIIMVVGAWLGARSRRAARCSGTITSSRIKAPSGTPVSTNAGTDATRSCCTKSHAATMCESAKNTADRVMRFGCVTSAVSRRRGRTSSWAKSKGQPTTDWSSVWRSVDVVHSSTRPPAGTNRSICLTRRSLSSCHRCSLISCACRVASAGNGVRQGRGRGIAAPSTSTGMTGMSR